MKGKLVHIDPSNPKPTAFCDRTDFPCMHADLRKQMEWSGGSLVWTGLMVHKDYLDKPQEAFRTPVIRNDPKPIRNPRPGRGPNAAPPLKELPDSKTQHELLENINFELNKKPDWF